MSTGFEKIWADHQLQEHWIRRFVAAIVDSIFMGLITLIFMALVFFVRYPSEFLLFSFAMGIFYMFYSATMESIYGWTVGKKIVNLKTTMLDGKSPTFDSALIRNVSKAFFVFLLLDVLIGLATPGDPHQKVTDRVARTTVITETPQMPPTASGEASVVVQPPPATP